MCVVDGRESYRQVIGELPREIEMVISEVSGGGIPAQEREQNLQLEERLNPAFNIGNILWNPPSAIILSQRHTIHQHSFFLVSYFIPMRTESLLSMCDGVWGNPARA